MKTSEKRPFDHAMAFYHKDGLPAAWKQAMRFAGKGGRIATMPDIVAARIESKPGDAPWETYYTTLTAEYYGISREGKRILIVAHGVGPMSTLEGIQKVYSWEYNDKDRRRRGGRITQQEFWDLEDGKYGYISIIDLDAYCQRYEYPFMQTLRSSEALTDPVLFARFGPDALLYVLAHTSHARAWHRQQAGIDPENKHGLPEATHQKYLDRRYAQHMRDMDTDSDPYIIQIQDESNLCYTFDSEHGHRPIEKGYAIAHLISTGRLCHLCHDGKESLTFDVSCHAWYDGTRIVGIRAGGSVKHGIHSGPDANNLLHKHWRELLEPVFPPNIEPIGFCALMQIEKQWFTQYPKKGESMDTWEPEYAVTSMQEIEQPVLFRTTVRGYHMFFRFGVKEVRAIAPPGANAYRFVSEPQNEWTGGNPTHQTAMVQFYHIEADTSKRMIRSNKLAHDYDKMMQLLQKEAV